MQIDRLRFSGLQRPTGLALILTAGLALPAQAQGYWPSNDRVDGYFEPRQVEQQPPRPRVIRKRTPKLADAPKDTAKPQGPIVIAISIDKQQLKLYDSNGLFAESPVSTGMRGHSTPMGVFSVIQKNKYHRSNIYSGAPMPYMQRITWSGVAMHAGVLPGYPASHGCIRMPMNFAMRMWGWTRMGARVIITPGEVSPEDFANAKLITRKPDTVAAVQPQSQPRPQKEASTTPKSDKSSVADAPRDNPELRLTAISDKSEPVRTADASGLIPQKSDAGGERPAEPAAAPADETKTSGENVTAAKPETAPGEGKTETEAAKPAETENASAKPSDAKADEVKADDRKTENINTSKDQARPTDAVAPPAAPSTAAEAAPAEGAAELIGPVKPRNGHIAAYISRKENKLFVRQNFEPWFETPVTIAAADRPLGTHVFTVRADKDNADTLRWSVVSLPAPARAAKRDEDTPRRKSKTLAAETAPLPPPSSPTEALDRVTIPADAMKRIAAALTPGGSIIVSDLGLGDETGRGTDFIVPLR